MLKREKLKNFKTLQSTSSLPMIGTKKIFYLKLKKKNKELI
jgi:hypothetical protein